MRGTYRWEKKGGCKGLPPISRAKEKEYPPARYHPYDGRGYGKGLGKGKGMGMGKGKGWGWHRPTYYPPQYLYSFPIPPSGTVMNETTVPAPTCPHPSNPLPQTPSPQPPSPQTPAIPHRGYGREDFPGAREVLLKF